MNINNKLVAFKGFIGRRDYILNLMYVSMINGILSAPFSIWLATAIQNPLEAFNLSALIKHAPVFALFFWGVACIISTVLSFGLMSRRIADIRGEEGLPVYILTAVLIALPYLWLFKMNPLTALGFLVSIIAGFVIMALNGKISGKIPHDPVKRFNWGAFWGTWIWGLFNKTYITLWSLLLFFTPAFFSWAIVCGIKGNEWAFKNKGAEDVEAFNKGQKIQAIIWNSIAAFTMFVLPIIISFLVFAFIFTNAIKNPEGMQKVVEKAENIIEVMIDDSFDGYDIGNNENSFYMDPQKWVGLSYNERYNLLKGAASVASIKKQRSDEKYHGGRMDEMFKTKIYSTYNDELLAEFNMDESMDVKDFKSAFKAVLKGLYFNTNPELPPPLP